MWSLVYIDGAWRYIGKLPAARVAPPMDDPALQNILDELSAADIDALLAEG